MSSRLQYDVRQNETLDRRDMTFKTTQKKTTRAVRPPSLKRQAVTLPSKIQQPVRPPKWISKLPHHTNAHIKLYDYPNNHCKQVIGRVNNSPTMQFFTGISRNTQLKLNMPSLTECVRDFQNNALWDIHLHAILL